MTGPEHYKDAEHYLNLIEQDDVRQTDVGKYLGLGQVHATLALAAATVDAKGIDYAPSGSWSDITTSVDF